MDELPLKEMTTKEFCCKHYSFEYYNKKCFVEIQFLVNPHTHPALPMLTLSPSTYSLSHFCHTSGALAEQTQQRPYFQRISSTAALQNQRICRKNSWSSVAEDMLECSGVSESKATENSQPPYERTSSRLNW